MASSSPEQPREPALPTRAIVLARGLGTRMRAAAPRDAPEIDAAQAAVAETGMKAMIPLHAGRPFLDHVLSGLADAGFTDLCLVVAPEHDAIRTYYTSSVAPRRVRIRFAVQHDARGTADALLAAESFAGSEPFLVLNGDNYYPPDVLRELRRQPPPALPGFSREGLLRGGQIPPERIAHYALLDVGADGVLRTIVEKPDHAVVAAMHGSPVSMNCWLLTADIFEACRRMPVSARGELELPLAVQFAIATMGMRVHVVPVDAPVLDLSRRADIPVVARSLEHVPVEL